MGKEIERKFLVTSDAWRSEGQSSLLRQGYISAEPGRIVRVRIDGDRGCITIKGKATGASCGEWEYPVPLQDAAELLDQVCEKPLIEKYRHRIARDGVLWEVDEFLGDNAGLVVAEIELESEEQGFVRPDWLGDEVTEDRRYANANLIRKPFSQW